MANQFSMVPHVNILRSRFKRDHTVKTTLNAGKLVPFLCDAVLPGDTYKVDTKLFCRMATLISPIMDDIYIDTFYFFVPLRLVWDNFQRFMGEQKNPGDSIDFVVPPFYSSNTKYQVEAESVLDYFGIPLGEFSLNKVSALPFRCYAAIWNDFFRDQNLQDSLPIATGDSGVFTGNTSTLLPGVNSFSSFNLSGSCLPRNKRHDYYTSALPWPLKDGLEVDIPLGGTIPVSGLSALSIPGHLPALDRAYNSISRVQNLDSEDAGFTYGSVPGVKYQSASDTPVLTDLQLSGIASANSTLTADLSNATTVTIETLRQSFMIQRFLERAAVTGTRYTEIIRGFFGVVSPDGRLQRPEYLGGTSERLDVNVVPQTSSSDGTSPQGNLAAFASGIVGNNNGFVKSFTEHGYLIGLVNIRAPLIYQQGLPRDFSKRTRFDFYWPQFAHLGEQTILNKEIYMQGTSADDDVFGYQERYAEYRYFPNMVTGKFRSTYAQSLDSWHLAQKFDSLPTLSNQFILDNPPIDRVIAVPSEPQFLLDALIRMDCARCMPVYGIPGLGERF